MTERLVPIIMLGAVVLISVMWVHGIAHEPKDYDGSDLFGE